jgi:hypothetical protein
MLLHLSAVSEWPSALAEALEDTTDDQKIASLNLAFDQHMEKGSRKTTNNYIISAVLRECIYKFILKNLAGFSSNF